MLFLFLLFSQLMAMDADTPTAQKPYDSPINTKSKRLHSTLEDVDFKFLLDECESYKLELKENKNPKYSKLFLTKISKLVEDYPNFFEIIYGENLQENDHSELFSQSVKKRKVHKEESCDSVFKEALEDVKPCLATPTKIGTNTYHFPMGGLIPEGTPRRAKNIISVFDERKMPVYVVNGQVSLYQMHHLCQHDQNEDIILISKEVHQRDSGVLHTHGKRSEINRNAFRIQKLGGTQLYFLRKIEQVLTKIISTSQNSENAAASIVVRHNIACQLNFD